MREYREEIEDGDQKDGCLNHKLIFNISTFINWIKIYWNTFLLHQLLIETTFIS